MTPDEFLRDFGAFTYSITIDGDTKVWSFTVDELRRQFDRQIRDHEEAYLQNPRNRPQPLRKGEALVPPPAKDRVAVLFCPTLGPKQWPTASVEAQH